MIDLSKDMYNQIDSMVEFLLESDVTPGEIQEALYDAVDESLEYWNDLKVMAERYKEVV